MKSKTHKQSMLVKALFAVLILPGSFGILIPFLIIINETEDNEIFFPGIIPIFIGVLILIKCIHEFYISGRGTLAPWSPPEKLVTTGLYKYTRNPMYIGVIIMVLGFALYFTSFFTILYASILFFGFHLRIIFYEEIYLQKHFGDEWNKYSGNIPRWFLKMTKH